MSEDDSFIFKLDLENGAGQTLKDSAIDLDGGSHSIGCLFGLGGILLLLTLVLPPSTAARSTDAHDRGGRTA